MTGDSPREFVCQLCQRTYERADHLSRHLDSHRNERSFKCSKCSRSFNRRDLLLRHQASHEKNDALGRAGPNRSSVRAIKACDTCVVSKLKCDDNRPCRRCTKRRISCVTDGRSPEHVSGNDNGPFSNTNDGRDEMRQRQLSIMSLQQDDELPDHAQGSGSVLNVESNIVGETSSGGEVVQLNNSISWNSTVWDSTLPFPPFFEQIMAPDFVASQFQSMPDIFSLMPDQDWLSENNDIFGVDFIPTIDQAIQLQASDLSAAQVKLSTQPDKSLANDNAKERFAMFQRSPWLWKPEVNSNAFSEHEILPLDERQVEMAQSPQQKFLPSLALPDELSSQNRDRIFQLVLRTAKSQVSVPTFPSTACLNTLLRVGFAKRMEVDPWIHPYTFDLESSRPELLVALIAAGCICFGVPSVSKTGLVLFEIARVALHRLAEEDNSVIRDLQYSQAYMLWVEVFAFCGFKRKMEVGEHSLQPLVTGLRRAGKFDRAAYSKIEPGMKDDERALSVKWKAWIEAESYKRLIHHLFDHDTYTTHAKFRNPLVSYAELSLPLPACRQLWLARSPEMWRSTFLSMTPPAIPEPLALRDLLAQSDLIQCLPTCVDATIARTAQLSGLAAQTWEYHQQSSVLTSQHASGSDPAAQLYLQLQHKRLYQSIQGAHHSLKDDLNVTQLACEFLMMGLHVSIDIIARFAGKCGEEEAHRAYQDLQSWRDTKEARTAICHAAKALMLAREVPPFQLRGCDSFLLYHSIMVLWTYSMLHRGVETLSSSTKTGLDQDTYVFLGEKDNDGTMAFVHMGVGKPCVRLPTCPDHVSTTERTDLEHFDLRKPQEVMTMGVKVFEGNLPNETRQNMPQLIKSFCALLSGLGSLTD